MEATGSQSDHPKPPCTPPATWPTTLNAKLVVVASTSGATALAMAKHRNFASTVGVKHFRSHPAPHVSLLGRDPSGRCPRRRSVPGRCCVTSIDWGQANGLLSPRRPRRPYHRHRPGHDRPQCRRGPRGRIDRRRAATPRIQRHAAHLQRVVLGRQAVNFLEDSRKLVRIPVAEPVCQFLHQDSLAPQDLGPHERIFSPSRYL